MIQVCRCNQTSFTYWKSTPCDGKVLYSSNKWFVETHTDRVGYTFLFCCVFPLVSWFQWFISSLHFILFILTFPCNSALIYYSVLLSWCLYSEYNNIRLYWCQKCSIIASQEDKRSWQGTAQEISQRNSSVFWSSRSSHTDWHLYIDSSIYKKYSKVPHLSPWMKARFPHHIPHKSR